MSKATLTRISAMILTAIVALSFSGCVASLRQAASKQVIDQVSPTEPAQDQRNSVPQTFSDEEEFATLQELLAADLVIEGTIVSEQTRWITDTTATNAELADRQARGLSITTPLIEYQVVIDKVLMGEAPSATIVAALSVGTKVGDRAILFLKDISGNPIQAPDQTKYEVFTSSGQFRIEKDNTLFSFKRKGMNPIADTYREKDKAVLEKDIQDLVAKLPRPTKADVLQNTLKSTGIVIEGTIQGVRDVHFVNSMEKSQQEIDQMLAEGKMPGLVLTDYTIIVDKVLVDMRSNNPRFFSNWKPLEPGQTIIVTRQGGTYQGVTDIEEPGPAFELGSREVLFLVGTSLLNYDLPDDGQSRYSTHSRQGRLLIEPNNRLTAFTQKGPGGIYGRQSLEELEQDIAQFLKEHPSASEEVPTPSRP